MHSHRISRHFRNSEYKEHSLGQSQTSGTGLATAGRTAPQTGEKALQEQRGFGVNMAWSGDTEGIDLAAELGTAEEFGVLIQGKWGEVLGHRSNNSKIQCFRKINPSGSSR